jgi:hypothetical protein
MATQFTNPTLMASRVFFQARQTSGEYTSLLGGIGIGLIEWMAADDELPLICPDVFVDMDLDWILRQVFPVALGTPSATMWTVAIDNQTVSQAKRRLETGASILIVVSNSSDFAGGARYNTVADVRCLIKE